MRDKRRVVIGVGTVGAGIVRGLLKKPGKVLAIDINPEKFGNVSLDNTIAELQTIIADFRETEKVVHILREFGPCDEVYITVAASCGTKFFWEESQDGLKAFLELTVVSLTLFLNAILKRDNNVLSEHAQIILLSSGDADAIASFEAVHGGEAAYVKKLARDIMAEMTATGRDDAAILTVLPGPVLDPAWKVAKTKPINVSKAGGILSDRLAEVIFEAIKKGKREIVTDWRVVAYMVIAPFLRAISLPMLEKGVYKIKKPLIQPR